MSSSSYKIPYHLDITYISDYLNKNMDKNMLMAIKGILIVNDVAIDCKELKSLNDEYLDYALEVNELPYNNAIGKYWWDSGYIAINVGEILNSTYDLQSFAKQFILTLVHEIRHSAQENPYLSEEVLSLDEGTLEDDAENYAFNWFFTHPFNPFKIKNGN